MHDPGAGTKPAGSVRRPVLLGLFTGTAVGLGFLLAGVPNVELMSLVVCLAGTVLGPWWGFGCGMLAAGLYSLGSPYGLPVPWILAGQTLGMGVVGLLGGMVAPVMRRLARSGRRTSAAILAGAVGLLGTSVFAVFTNLMIVLAFGGEPRVVAAGALPFFLIHAGFNTMIFAGFLPLLIRRLGRLGTDPLQGRILPVILVAMTVASAVPGTANAQTAGPDSAAVVPPRAAAQAAVPETPHGWKRALWTPFAPSPVARLDWFSSWIPIQDGGLGSVVRILGEASTSPVPLVLRDGIPQGTGHVLADDPWLLPQIGHRLESAPSGLDGFGGSGGRLDLVRHDPRPQEAFSEYLGAKGRHESYLRGIRLLTPEAAWRLAFEFQESLDIEGYNHTDGPDLEFDPEPDDYFPGHGRIRSSHASLTRQLDEDASLTVDFDLGRKTKDSLPALGAEHQEVWDDGLAVTMKTRAGRLGLVAGAHLRSRDVAWGDKLTPTDSLMRTIETGREGIIFELAWHSASPVRPVGELAVPDSAAGVADTVAAASDSLAASAGDPPLPLPRIPTPVARTRLRLTFDNWTLSDTGADTQWAGDLAGPISARGQMARLALQTGREVGPAVVTLNGGGVWDKQLGWVEEFRAGIAQPGLRPWWRLFWEQGGRAPRSDERATPIRHFVAERELVLMPDADLQREKTMRYGGGLSGRLLGLDLAVEGARIELRQGITWMADGGETDRGRWANALDLDSSRLTATVGRQGRFLGWGRVFLEGTWQDFEVQAGRASLLPPERYLRMHLMWENHFFEEDGVLQLALLSTRTGEMADPWDVTRTLMLPERTVHDLLVGFRLVGTHISIAFRNLTSEKHRLTAGGYSSDREVDLRLAWAFSH